MAARLLDGHDAAWGFRPPVLDCTQLRRHGHVQKFFARTQASVPEWRVTPFPAVSLKGAPQRANLQCCIAQAA